MSNWYYDDKKWMYSIDYCHHMYNIHTCPITTLSTPTPTSVTMLFDYIDGYAAQVDFDIMRGYHDFVMVSRDSFNTLFPH